MAKKYVPSGYQIINLPDVELDDQGHATINYGDYPDGDILIDLATSGLLGKKPILLNFIDVQGFATIVGENYISISNLIDGNDIYVYSLSINIEQKKILVSMITYSI